MRILTLPLALAALIPIVSGWAQTQTRPALMEQVGKENLPAQTLVSTIWWRSRSMMRPN